MVYALFIWFASIKLISKIAFSFIWDPIILSTENDKFLGAVTVVASFTLVTLAAGPIFGIGSFLAFRHAVNTGKWNPDGKYLNYIKDNLEWMLNRNSKSKEEVGGRSK